MATHTIGTGGDFSTPQAWEDDIPTTLTAQRIGQCKNQEFSGTPVINFSAHTTVLSTLDVILETESGASFKDNANIRTNALRYNSANGAGFVSSSDYDYQAAIYVSGVINHLTIRNLQVKAARFPIHYLFSVADPTTNLFKDMIFEKTGNANSPVVTVMAKRLDNVLIIQRGTAGNGLFCTSGGVNLATVVNGCGIVRPSNVTAAGTGLTRLYVVPIVKSSSVFGFSTDCGTGFDSTSDYNATSKSDAASGFPDPATDHNVYDCVYDTALFVQPSDASGGHDFRTLTGSALVNTGLLDSTNAPNDISGQARSDPPEIGVWELAAAGGTTRGTPFGHRGTAFNGGRALHGILQ